ncbi:ArsA family ATPase [Microbacterium album]|uniref:ArsA/GET3 Anion-transporting ATPase-like domain-containing protein n=1 Tax=Microbacterium album TaxID=2053191 RepID=A0A917IFI6_9MICO|nr:ArsA family ATPase [Microbacterium album]GGH44417.1 hypothetical protein GCM10010921_19050 [Microbacterium album]
MLLDALDARRVLFVGGKGGVGKTSLGSAIALARAREGARVLVVSTDPAHSLGHLWQQALGDDPSRLATTAAGGIVDGLEIDPARTVMRHLEAVGDAMRRLLPERLHAAARRHLELARDAPGTHESAVLERVAETLEHGLDRYDLVVFDTAPSGHTLRLLSLPGGLASWTESLLANRERSEGFAAAMRRLGGRDERARDAELRRVLLIRRERFARLRDVLANPETAGFVVVFVPEPLPVAETLEILDRLRELGIAVVAAVANRRSPADAGRLLAGRRAREEALLADLRERLPDVPRVDLPLLEGALVGEEAVGALADLVGRT